MTRSNRNAGHVDWWLVAMYFLIVLLGWLNIYSASFNEAHPGLFDFGASQGKQFLWICICTALAGGIMISESRIFSAFSFFFFGGAILLLLSVLLIGQTVNGSKSWFVITSSIKFQPVELAKFATSLALASVISLQDFQFLRRKYFFMVAGVIGLPALLVLMQNDTGSFLVFTSFGLMLFRFGLPWVIAVTAVLLAGIFLGSVFWGILPVIIGVGILAVLIFLFMKKSKRSVAGLIGLTALAIGFAYGSKTLYQDVLQPHQQTRIRVWLGLEKDLRGSGWNVHQSKVAIGSGGFSGKGYLDGALTKLNFVPEQNTDYIFTTVGEEEGFIGASLTLILFAAFLGRILIAAERQRSVFAKVYGYCVFSIIFFHYFMNVGMVLGLIPTVGIPLPFFSYGGSSLLGFSLLIWVFIKLDSVNLEQF